ncbi:MAG: metal ABC transporter substrate-binding protein [Clostridiaceae bacterium]
MKNRICLLLVVVLLLLTGCTNGTANGGTDNTDSEAQASKEVKLDIVTTDRALYYMVKDIVGDKHNVEYMFRNMDSQLFFTFTDDSLYNIAKKDLFIYMGASYEPWIPTFSDKINKSKVGMINASRGVKTIALNKAGTYNDIVIKENPYYLLNYDNYKIALLNIKNSIQDKDPKNRNYYEKNFNEVVKKTEEEQAKIGKIISNISDYKFIYSEEEFGYFIKYYSMNSLWLDLNEEGSTTKYANSQAVSAAVRNPSKIVFLYNSSKALKDNEELIKKYDLSTLRVKICRNDISYEEMLLLNESLFESYYDSIDIKK